MRRGFASEDVIVVRQVPIDLNVSLWRVNRIYGVVDVIVSQPRPIRQRKQRLHVLRHRIHPAYWDGLVCEGLTIEGVEDRSLVSFRENTLPLQRSRNGDYV